MTGRVVLSTAAEQDLLEITEWLLQTGSGYRAHRKLDDIEEAIRELPEKYFLHAVEPGKTDCRLAIVHGHAVRYSRRPDGAVFVHRVFGPGRLR